MINLNELKEKTKEKKYDDVWNIFLAEYKEMLKNFLIRHKEIEEDGIEYTFNELLNIFHKYEDEKYVDIYDTFFNMYVEEDISYIDVINYSLDNYINIKKVLES